MQSRFDIDGSFVELGYFFSLVRVNLVKKKSIEYRVKWRDASWYTLERGQTWINENVRNN